MNHWGIISAMNIGLLVISAGLVRASFLLDAKVMMVIKTHSGKSYSNIKKSQVTHVLFEKE
jgi:hypothetical protein